MRTYDAIKEFSICWDDDFSACGLKSSLGGLTRDPCCPLFATIPLETCSLHAFIPPVILPYFSPISGASGKLPNVLAQGA